MMRHEVMAGDMRLTGCECIDVGAAAAAAASGDSGKPPRQCRMHVSSHFVGFALSHELF